MHGNAFLASIMPRYPQGQPLRPGTVMPTVMVADYGLRGRRGGSAEVLSGWAAPRSMKRRARGGFGLGFDLAFVLQYVLYCKEYG